MGWEALALSASAALSDRSEPVLNTAIPDGSAEMEGEAEEEAEVEGEAKILSGVKGEAKGEEE